jgi:hypothetical protein
MNLFMTIMTPIILLAFGVSLVYYLVIFPKEKDERRSRILQIASEKAYLVLVFGIAMCIVLGRIPSLSFEGETFKSGIVLCIAISGIVYSCYTVYYNRKI